MIGYEFRKIFSHKIVYLTIIILLLSNSIVCHLSLASIPYSKIDKENIDSLFSLYYDNPSYIVENYNDLCTQKSLNDIARRNAIESGIEYEQSNIYETQTLSKNLSDFHIYTDLFETIDYIKSYPFTIDELINQAISNRTELETSSFSTNSYSYAYKYQNKIINTYTSIKNNVIMGLEYRCGWEPYFTYTADDIFLFIIFLIVGAVSLTEEFSKGTISLVYVSKKGRFSFIISKLASVYLIVIFLVILFSIESFIIIFFEVGYSNPTNALQFLPDFVLSPFAISILTFFFLDLFIKIVTYVLFTTFVVLVSIIFKSALLTYTANIFFLGINLFFFVFQKLPSLFKHFNLFSLADTSIFFTRYRSINFWGNIVGYELLLPMMLIISFGILLSSTIFFFCNVNISNQRKISYPHSFRYKKDKSQIIAKQKNYTSSSFLFETYKTLISCKLCFIIILALILECVLVLGSTSTQDQTDIIYHDYMDYLHGTISPSKEDFISQERTTLNKSLSKYEETQILFTSGSITAAELKTFLHEYNYAISHTTPLEIVEQQMQYLNQLKNNGISAWFLYDTGWKKLLNPSIEWILILIISIVVSNVFTIEYLNTSSSGSFSQILRTTKNGRKKTLISKFVFSISISLILTCIWNALRFIETYLHYDLPSPDAPIVSISIFNSFPSSLTILQYLIFLYFFKLFATTILVCLVGSLSILTKNAISSLSITIAITLLPNLLSSFGISFLSDFDFTYFLCGTPFFIRNSYPVIFIFATLTLCTYLLFLAERKWNK